MNRRKNFKRPIDYDASQIFPKITQKCFPFHFPEVMKTMLCWKEIK